MASAAYNIGQQGLIDGTIDLNTHTIKVRLVTSSYTFAATHTTMSNVGAGVGTDPTLASVTVTDGAFDAADATWTAVTAGSTVNAAVIYKFVSNDAGSTPIAYIDITDTATNGGDITLQWGSNIFAITG
jgi:hypothetical protein